MLWTYLETPLEDVNEDIFWSLISSSDGEGIRNWDHEAMKNEKAMLYTNCAGISYFIPPHIQNLVRIVWYKKECRLITVATRASMRYSKGSRDVGLRITVQISFGRREHAHACILLFCQRRIALPFTRT